MHLDIQRNIVLREQSEEHIEIPHWHKYAESRDTQQHMVRHTQRGM